MPAKRIGIDVRLWAQGGVGRYIRNLVCELDAMKSPYEITLIARPEEKDEVAKAAPSLRVIGSLSLWHHMSEQTELLGLLHRESFDLVHFPYISHPVGYGGRFVITVHDATMFTHATGRASTHNALAYWVKKLGYRMVLGHGLSSSCRIIVPTHAVADELVRSFHIARERIAVTYEGVDPRLRRAKVQKIPAPAHKFYLYVGNCYPHKNTDLLLSLAARADHPFVIVAPDDSFTQAFLLQAQQRGVADKLSVVRNLADGGLRYLYEHARALVLPSFKEGFGLPVVEGAFFGCPLVLSAIPAFREIAPDHAVFFDPSSVSAAFTALQSAPVRSRLSYHRSYFDRFSFQTMAQETLQLYAQCLKSA